MHRFSFLILFFSCIGFSYGQFGPVNIIDDTPTSEGIKNIATADLTNNGRQDIIVAQAGQTDHVGIYMNTGGGSFAPKIVVDSNLNDPVYIATGDFDNNGWIDIATITQTDGEVFWYPNTNGSFNQRIMLDSGIFFGNALVAADFDSDGVDDLVVIGQHSIDLFLNDGMGNFTKEHILTTSTSPNVLDCLYIEVADMNGNGIPDVVVGETIGGVIYFNDGTGNFTPQVFTNEGFITTALHVFDTNNDGALDVVLRYSTNDVYLYLNDGTGTMNSSGVLFNAPAINSMASVDVDGDGFLDVYTSYDQKARVHYNDGNSGFSNSAVVYEEAGLFIYEVALSDLKNNGSQEFIWSGAGNTIAYQENAILSAPGFEKTSFVLYPNPAKENIFIKNTGNPIEALKIISVKGQVIYEHKGNISEVDVSGLKAGIYFIKITSGGKEWVERILKH